MIQGELEGTGQLRTQPAGAEECQHIELETQLVWESACLPRTKPRVLSPVLHKLGPEINQVLGQLKLHSKSEGQSEVSGVQAKKNQKRQGGEEENANVWRVGKPGETD